MTAVAISPMRDAVDAVLSLKGIVEEVGGGDRLFSSIKSRAQNTPSAVSDMGVPPVLLFLASKVRREFYEYACRRMFGLEAVPPNEVKAERDGYSAYLAVVAWYLTKLLGKQPEEISKLEEVVKLAKKLDDPAEVGERALVHSLLLTYLIELKKAAEAILPD